MKISTNINLDVNTTIFLHFLTKLGIKNPHFDITPSSHGYFLRFK